MKRILLISFDFLREEDPKTSLAIGSILSYLHSREEYGDKFEAYHYTINMYSMIENMTIKDIVDNLPYENINMFNYIAISAYVWSEKYLNNLMSFLREEYFFKGEFILGGYQISYSNNPLLEYPNCNLFVDGYGEKAIYEILIGRHKKGVIRSSLNLDNIPSPYLSGIIPIQLNQAKVRIETKRGCPYRCNFCAHRDLTNNKVISKNNHRVFEELAFLKEKNVQKINILDPIFNAGSDYLKVLKEVLRLGINAEISIQTRFETIHGEAGKEFLNLCQKLNIHLEFGLQTAIREESILIKRKNQPLKIKQVMEELNQRNISYEVSLIYGLPSQTLKSFEKSISFLKENGCHNIKAFPLMLLKGTELYFEKEKYSFKEKIVNNFDIPVVVRSNSFSKRDWKEMNRLAEKLSYSSKRI